MSALRSLLLLLLPLSLGPGPGPGPGSEAKVTRSCTETRQVLGARGYSLSLLPPALISGEHLRICPQEYTCCSSEIEQRLTWETEATFRGLVEESGSFLIHTLAARHRTFDEVFREMLSSSEHSLALLFQRSYGRLYSQYSPLFSGLFSRLRDYYERSSEGLDDALVDFWAQLLERMFPLLHPQYIFSPDYLFCLTRLASSADDSLKPFGDSPRRLRLQITRALVAARAFIQGLETGRDVVREALKVFQECGSPQPAPARARRAPAPREEADRLWTAAAEERPTTAAGTSLPRLVSGGRASGRLRRQRQGRALQLGPLSLLAQVWELRERLGRVRGFWAGLPLTVCGDLRMAADISQEAAPCWTGAERGRYLSPVVGGSQTEQLNNPELDAESSSPDLQTRRRRLQLRAATTRMRAAALGRDLDLEDWDEDASGSGEGQHYADDWMAGAAAVAPPARPPRPPRRDGAGGKGGGVIVRHNQGKTRTGGTSVGFHTQPILILFLSALALLGPR
ncbi:hypothetical protein HPG69_002840 [Diceros bicornis minor]|uniref:Glypican 2 n=1 Tax=Diceros bicornis minor TaxID=77932 RepID=A0A7J7ER06_DICBM|nr:hypothetical protein HPG69_002840 [Diceros bicornis minor]